MIEVFMTFADIRADDRFRDVDDVLLRHACVNYLAKYKRLGGAYVMQPLFLKAEVCFYRKEDVDRLAEEGLPFTLWNVVDVINGQDVSNRYMRELVYAACIHYWEDRAKLFYPLVGEDGYELVQHPDETFAGDVSRLYMVQPVYETVMQHLEEL